jgi:Putative cyclase
MYNGYPMREVTDEGAGKNGILNYKNGIITRGVLMDIARLKGVGYLEPGTAIYPEDLDAWERKAHLKVGPGDVVFIRTLDVGHAATPKGPGSVQEAGLAGLYASCARWLKAARCRDIGRRRSAGRHTVPG